MIQHDPLNRRQRKHTSMKTLPSTEENIKKAASLINDGRVIVYPTETVYGLGCLPSDPDAAKRICELKGRADKPLPLICSSTEAARRIVDMTPAAEKLASTFWPGPLTIVLPAKVKYSTWVTHGAKTLGVRVTSHHVASMLAKLSGGVIVSTSANKSGEESCKTAEEVEKVFGSKVDLILDDGPSLGNQSSTVLEMSGEDPWILRSGPITGEQILKVLRS